MSVQAIEAAAVGTVREASAVVLLREVDPWLRGRVLELAPLRSQLRFSGRPSETLPAAEADPARRPVAMVERGCPVGFFVLHRGPVAGLAPGPADVLVRGFMVDAAHQGRGVATAALARLPEFATAAEPQTQRLVLGVNVRNHVARHTYLRAGFEDTGHLFLGGALGPQHVLVRDARP